MYVWNNLGMWTYYEFYEMEVQIKYFEGKLASELRCAVSVMHTGFKDLVWKKDFLKIKH